MNNKETMEMVANVYNLIFDIKTSGNDVVNMAKAHIMLQTLLDKLSKETGTEIKFNSQGENNDL